MAAAATAAERRVVARIHDNMADFASIGRVVDHAGRMVPVEQFAADATADGDDEEAARRGPGAEIPGSGGDVVQQRDGAAGARPQVRLEVGYGRVRADERRRIEVRPPVGDGSGKRHHERRIGRKEVQRFAMVGGDAGRDGIPDFRGRVSPEEVFDVAATHGLETAIASDRAPEPGAAEINDQRGHRMAELRG